MWDKSKGQGNAIFDIKLKGSVLSSVVTDNYVSLYIYTYIYR